MIIQENDRYVIHGPITMSNASSVLEEGVDLLNQGEMVIDFAQVEEVDSSAVSLMLEWMRHATQQGRPLRFTGLPENLKSLAALYDVLELIPQT